MTSFIENKLLVEAARVTNKHLCTLEAGISEGQTNQMMQHHLQLVVPTKYHYTYSTAQQAWLLSLADFIAVVNSKH